MNAVRFIEERNRMCKSFDKCSYGCPAWDGSCKLETGTNLECEADKPVAIVKEWSAAHPRKTRQDVFLEQWPEAMIESDGVIAICPAALDKSYSKTHCTHILTKEGCASCRSKFWGKVVE